MTHEQATISGAAQCLAGLAKQMGHRGLDQVEVTVFQDAKGQGKAVVESVQKLLKKEKFESPYVYVPFELVTKENYKEYLKRL